MRSIPPRNAARRWRCGAWGVTVGPVLGPILGGWLTENYSWRWVFYVNVPFGVLAALGLLIYLKETPRNAAAKLDWVGFATLSLALGAFQMMLDRGEEMDWFSSAEIVTEACVAGVGIYCFLVQSALAPKPFLSPRLLTDLNFVVASAFIFVVGVIIYATMALLAPFLQTLLNYPVITAGLVLAPRGLGTMSSMLVVGRVIQRFGARPLVAFGIVLSIYSLFQMSQWTADVSEFTIISVGLMQGFSIGFIFVPLSTVVFTTLAPELRTEASGVYSLMRNLGSAIGISVTGSLLISNTQVNHSFIIGAVTPFNRALQSGAAAQFWSPLSVHGANALDAEVRRQASVIAYLDDFKLMMWLCVAVLPLVVLIRPPRAVRVAQNA